MKKDEILNWLRENKAFKDEKLSSGITTTIKNKYPAFLLDVNNILGTSFTNISQAIYHLTHDNVETLCPVCNQEKPFLSYGQGYRETCGGKNCIAELTLKTMRENSLEKNGVLYPIQRKDVREKQKQTLLARYGVDNSSKIKNFSEKSKKTCLEKYGVEHPLQNKEIKEKARKTSLEKYGVEHPSQSQEIKDKHEKTNLEKYGCKCSLQSKQSLEKIKETCLKKYGVDHPSKAEEIKKITAQGRKIKAYERISTGARLQYVAEPLFTLEEYLEKGGSSGIYKFRCKTCNTVFEDDVSDGKLPICPVCNPKPTGASKEEKALVSEIRKFYKGIILENDRRTIYPKELDIYIPEKKIAIEFDGCYWHSEQSGHKPSADLEKTITCEQKGIHLLHIFEDEWRYKKEIVLDIIKNALGIYDIKIGARKCSIVDLSTEKQKVFNFLEENHIQGSTGFSIAYGLLYQDNLVTVIAFGKTRFNKEADYELYRFVNKKGFHVIGAFSKLLNFFKEQHPNNTIITYSERRLFTGNVYRQTGFLELKPTVQDYWYVEKDSSRRLSRELFQKQKLLKKYGDQYRDWTEHEIANYFGYYRIYGCGNWKFILENQKHLSD